MGIVFIFIGILAYIKTKSLDNRLYNKPGHVCMQSTLRNPPSESNDSPTFASQHMNYLKSPKHSNSVSRILGATAEANAPLSVEGIYLSEAFYFHGDLILDYRNWRLCFHFLQKTEFKDFVYYCFSFHGLEHKTIFCV